MKRYSAWDVAFGICTAACIFGVIYMLTWLF